MISKLAVLTYTPPPPFKHRVLLNHSLKSKHRPKAQLNIMRRKSIWINQK